MGNAAKYMVRANFNSTYHFSRVFVRDPKKKNVKWNHHTYYHMKDIVFLKRRRWEAEEDDGEMYDEFGNLKKKFRAKLQQAESCQVLSGTGRVGWEVEELGMSDRDRRERSRDRERERDRDERETTKLKGLEDRDRRRSRSRERERGRDRGRGYENDRHIEYGRDRDRDRRERERHRTKVVENLIHQKC